MRKFLPQFLFVTIALVGIGFFFAPHVASAQLLDVTAWISNGIYGILANFLQAIAMALSWVIWLVGQVVDFALVLTLNNSFFDSAAINTTWSIIRDLCNMLFIFVLIWLGLRTILSLSDISVKKTITNVVIAAILINFSLFMTRAIIDVSNIATSWFVQGIQNIGGGTGVSDSVRGALEMEKLVIKSGTGENAGLQSFVAQFARIIIYGVAIYMFFQVAFLLLARIISFVFLLVTSPVAFMGQLELEDLSKTSNDWWKELRSQALMGPMFFLMLYITLYIVDNINELAGSTNGSPDPISGSSFGPTNYVMFALIVLMLLKCLNEAKKWSGELGDQMAGYLKSAATFATGAVAVRTIGLAGSAIKSNATLQKMASSGGFGGAVAKQTLQAGNYAAKSDFGMTAAYKNLSKGTPIAGQFKGADKGYEGLVDREKKNDVEFAKLLGKGKAGEENRLRYAQNLPKSVYYNTLGRLGMERAGSLKAADDIKESATKAYLKAEKDDPRKKAEKAKTDMVYAEMRKRDLDKALEAKDAKKNDAALQREIKETEVLISGLQKEIKKMEATKGAGKKAQERENLVENLGKMSPTDAPIAEARIKALDKELEDYDKTKATVKRNVNDIEEMKGYGSKTPDEVEQMIIKRRDQIAGDIKIHESDFKKSKDKAQEKKDELGILTQEDKKAGDDDDDKKKGGGGDAPAPKAS